VARSVGGNVGTGAKWLGFLVGDGRMMSAFGMFNGAGVSYSKKMPRPWRRRDSLPAMCSVKTSL